MMSTRAIDRPAATKNGVDNQPPASRLPTPGPSTIPTLIAAPSSPSQWSSGEALSLAKAIVVVVRPTKKYLRAPRG